MARLTDYHSSDYGTCDGKTYARQGFDVAGYWTEKGREPRPAVSEGGGLEIECGTNNDFNPSTYEDYEGTDDFVNNYLEPRIREIFDEGFFKYQSDSSIDYEHPVEIISQVFTRGWYNNGGREKLMRLFDEIFVDLNIHQNSSCGNHINISRAMFINDRSAWLFDEAINNNFDYYCYKFGRSDFEGQHIDTSYFERRCVDERQGGHYTAVNWTHWNEGASSRLEVRIVGRASDGEEYCSYIDTVFDLVDECNRRAKAEKASVKKAYMSQEIYEYERDGRCLQRSVEYRPGYTGSWFVEEDTNCKKTTKDGISRQILQYNSDGVVINKKTEYYNIKKASGQSVLRQTISYTDAGKMMTKRTEYYV